MIELSENERQVLISFFNRKDVYDCLSEGDQKIVRSYLFPKQIPLPEGAGIDERKKQKSLLGFIDIALSFHQVVSLEDPTVSVLTDLKERLRIPELEHRNEYLVVGKDLVRALDFDNIYLRATEDQLELVVDGLIIRKSALDMIRFLATLGDGEEDIKKAIQDSNPIVLRQNMQNTLGSL